ncbi:MAG: hypothetical protein K2I20_01530 [Clostridia bacterium]|nr:hypothetical protein [Clostridia bacterium]
MSYPKTSVKQTDALAAKGSFKVGCKILNGELLPEALCFDEVETPPKNAVWADYSAASKRFFAFAEGKLFTSPSGEKFVEIAAAQGEPFLIEEVENGRHNSFVICGAKCVVYDGQTFFEKPLNRGIYAGVMKCGRLFCADLDDKTVLRWSGTDGAFDWEESISGAGWLKLDAAFGAILNLAVLDDYVAVVREFGITLLSAFGSPENFKQQNKLQKTPKIFKNTAAVINGKLYFYTAEGLCFYDGNKLLKITLNEGETFENPAYAAVYGQKYCVCGFSARLNRKAVLVYEPADGDGYLIDFPATSLCAHEKLLAFTEEGAFIAKCGGNYAFESGEITFGTVKNKTLTKIEIFGGKADVEISNGVVLRILGGVSGSARVNLRGGSFKITVKGSEKLSGVKAFAEVGYEI